MSLGKLAKSYVFWTYERGSLHYDVMVTAILVFMFGAPRLINFKDKPVETVALHASEVLVREDGASGERARFIYEVRADDIGSARTDPEIRAAILRVVEPISDEVTLDHYEAIKDSSGRVVAYQAWILK